VNLPLLSWIIWYIYVTISKYLIFPSCQTIVSREMVKTVRWFFREPVHDIDDRSVSQITHQVGRCESVVTWWSGTGTTPDHEPGRGLEEIRQGRARGDRINGSLERKRRGINYRSCKRRTIRHRLLIALTGRDGSNGSPFPSRRCSERVHLASLSLSFRRVSMRYIFVYLNRIIDPFSICRGRLFVVPITYSTRAR